MVIRLNIIRQMASRLTGQYDGAQSSKLRSFWTSPPIGRHGFSSGRIAFPIRPEVSPGSQDAGEVVCNNTG